MWWFFSCTYPFSGFSFPLDRLQSPWHHHKALYKLCWAPFLLDPSHHTSCDTCTWMCQALLGPESFLSCASAAMPLLPSLLDESWGSIQWSLPLWRSSESPTPDAMSVLPSRVLMTLCTQTCYSFDETVMWVLVWMPLSLLTHHFPGKWSHSPLCPR